MNYEKVLHKCRKTGKFSHEDFKTLEIHIFNLEKKAEKSRELLSRHIHYWNMLKELENDPNPLKGLIYILKEMNAVQFEKEMIELLEKENIN